MRKSLFVVITLCFSAVSANAGLRMYLPFSGDYENLGDPNYVATYMQDPCEALNINFTAETAGSAANFNNRLGTALPALGSGSYVKIMPKDSVGSVLGPSGTLVMLMNVDELYQYQGVWDMANPIYAQYWQCWIYPNSRLTWRLYGTRTPDVAGAAGTYLDATGQNLIGKWFQYAITWGQYTSGTSLRASIRLWINGKLAAQADSAWINPGIFQLSSHNTGNQGYCGKIDEFRIYDEEFDADMHSNGYVSNALLALIPKAGTPFPADGTHFGPEGIAPQTLTWSVDADVVSSSLYFGTDSSFASGPVLTNTTATQWTTPALELGNKYYWRVDCTDANGIVHTGATWRMDTLTFDGDLNKDGYVNFADFAEVAPYWQQDNIEPMHEQVIDNFESYATTTDMAAYWDIDGLATSTAGGWSVLATDPCATYNKYLRFHYDVDPNDPTHTASGGYCWWDTGYAFSTPFDISQWDHFIIKARREIGNSTESQCYFKLVDVNETGSPLTAAEGVSLSTSDDPNVWVSWDMDLNNMNYYSFNSTPPYYRKSQITKCVGLIIGVINKLVTGGGEGTIDFDNIVVQTNPYCRGAQPMDLNGDCRVDFADLNVIVADWAKTIY